MILQLSWSYPDLAGRKLQEREREDIDRVARTRFALSLNDEERNTIEGAEVMICSPSPPFSMFLCLKFYFCSLNWETALYLQKESAAYWEKRMELVGQMSTFAKRRKELMAPAVHQVFKVIERGQKVFCLAQKDKKKNYLPHFKLLPFRMAN